MSQEYWHEKKDDDLAALVFEAIRGIENDQAGVNFIRARCAQLYNNFDIAGFSTSTGRLKQYLAFATGDNRLSLNVVGSCIKTVTSMVARAEPRVQFLTSNGDEDLQRRAQNMTRYVDAVFYDTKVYEAAQRSFVDACVFGTGALKVYVKHRRICIERVWPGDILVDANDGQYGPPQEIHQRSFVQRSVLKKLYPEMADKIDSVEQSNGQREAGDQVTVVESWRRPSAPGSKDGKHTICTEKCVLFEETYKHDWFPFAFIRWEHAMSGFYGMSLAYELAPLQLEINKMARNIALAQQLLAVPRVFVEEMTDLNTSDIEDNIIGKVVKYKGNVPVVYVPTSTMPADYFQHLWALYAKAYELSGISQLNAGGLKPAGLNSGAAMRVHNDIQSSRFSIIEKQYSQLFVDIAEISIELSKELFGGRKNAIVKGLDITGSGPSFHREMEWSDIDMDRDRFSMRPYPVNALGDKPAGRLQFATELVSAGMFDRETAVALLDFPDVEAAIKRSTAPLKAVQAQLDRMLDTGEYEPPDKYMNLQLCINQASTEYSLELAKPLPDDSKLEDLRNYMDEAMRLLKQANATNAPAATPPQDPAAAGMAAVKLAG